MQILIKVYFATLRGSLEVNLFKDIMGKKIDIIQD